MSTNPGNRNNMKEERSLLHIEGNIVTENEIVSGFITVERGRIVAVSQSKPEGQILHFRDHYIVPGFIDLHIHGIHTFLSDNGPEDLSSICLTLPQYGVTGFLPTIAPRPKGEDAAFLSRLAQTKTSGAEIVGFHLEGPFLKITGALGSGAISGADSERVKALIKAALPYKAIFSISPDVEGIEKLLPLMVKNNTPVFMTHTAATVEETQKAIQAGARHATHFYDVFPCPRVTEPGVRPCGAVEAILADERVSVDFILDGVHVDPVAVTMALVAKSKGPGKVSLITDANIGAGLNPGRFSFGNLPDVYFTAKGEPARSVADDTLAGSGLTMDQALRNAMAWLKLDLVEAVKLVSYHPAKVLGIDDRKGLLSTGYDADFVILNDSHEVIQTWINGECKYKNDYQR